MVSDSSTLGRLRTSNEFVTFVVCTAIFTDSFIYDLIIPFIPQMLERRLHLPHDQVQIWTSTLLGVFGGSFAIGNVLAGFLTDHSPSTKFPFLLGIITMVASSLSFFLGQHIGMVVVARALQGLAASFVWVSGLAFLNIQIKPSYIGTAMGYVSLAMAVGELLGPLIGGVMYEHAGHFAVLGLVCGVLAIDILLRLLLIEKQSNPGQQRSPGRDNEQRPLLHEETREDEVTDLSAVDVNEGVELSHVNLFGFRMNIDLCATFYAACIVGTVRYAFESALIVFVSNQFFWSTSASGGILFAFLSPAMFGPLVGRLTTKHGPRWISVATFGTSSVSLVALGFLTRPTTIGQVLFVVIVAVIGVCVSSLTIVLTIAFSTATKLRELRAKQAGWNGSTGSAFGGFSLAWTVGMFVGPAAAELFVDHIDWLAFCMFLAALCAVSAGVMSFAWRRWEVPDEQ